MSLVVDQVIYNLQRMYAYMSMLYVYNAATIRFDGTTGLLLSIFQHL